MSDFDWKRQRKEIRTLYNEFFRETLKYVKVLAGEENFDLHVSQKIPAG